MESLNDSIKSHLYFDIHSSIIFQVGESLITDPVQALVELIKNAYDADSSYAKIEIETDKINNIENSHYPQAKGFIRIEDDGHGMGMKEIENGWLTISNSLKKTMKEKGEKTGKGRTPLGDKGLGRFGAQRLGYNLEIFTKTEAEDFEYHVAFSWKDFMKKDKLGEVPILIEKIPCSRKKGTIILVSDIKEPDYFKDKESKKPTGNAGYLQMELSKMICPYEEIKGFSILAKINGKQLDLASINDEILKGSELNYTISFDEKVLEIKGKARIGFIRPQGKEDKILFRTLVEKDEGKEFFDYLSSQPKAKKFDLIRSPKPGWFVEYELKRPFEDIDKYEMIDENPGSPVIANPGRFLGVIDAFTLSREAADQQEVFNNISEYKQYIKDLSGVRVYRDGFGVRVDNDWLEFGKQWTSGPSYYGLKAENTLGYISLSAEYNKKLEETTNREGFKLTPFYKNFYEMLRLFVKFAGETQEFLRRGWIEFRNRHHEKEAGIEPGTAPEDLTGTISKSLSKASQYHTFADTLRLVINEKISNTQESIGHISDRLPGDFELLPELKESVKLLKKNIAEANEIVVSINKYLDEISTLDNVVKVLGNQIENLRDQSAQLYEAASLGLTAEALSHEIQNISDRLAGRCSDLRAYLKNQSRRDPKTLGFIEHVDTAVSALRKQLSHLAPSLKYVREKRQKIDIFNFCREIAFYHRERLREKGIDIQVSTKSDQEFIIYMNSGKLTQIFDNLFLNSDYWLCENIRTKTVKQGKITIIIDKPFIRFLDNGRGIDPSVETTLFEPFVTTKGKGRGLGLFLVQHFLAAEGCSISLLPERNKDDRLYIFEINFTGGMDDR